MDGMDGHDESYHEDGHDVPDDHFWDGDGDHSPGGVPDAADWLTDDGHEHHEPGAESEPWADHPHEPDADLDHASEFDAGFTPHSEAPSHAADFSSEPETHDAREEADAGDPAPADVTIGTDPELAAHSSDTWLDLPDLDHLELPEPSGGGPWIDAAFLGAEPAAEPLDVAPAHPVGVLADLRTALGEPAGVDVAFERLLASEDPAVRALAHLWRP